MYNSWDLRTMVALDNSKKTRKKSLQPKTVGCKRCTTPMTRAVRAQFSLANSAGTRAERPSHSLAPREIGPRDSSSLWPTFCRPPGARPCTCLARRTTERRHSSRSRLLRCSPHLELIDAVTSLCPMPPMRGLSKRASSPVSQAPSHGYSKACCMR